MDYKNIVLWDVTSTTSYRIILLPLEGSELNLCGMQY